MHPALGAVVCHGGIDLVPKLCQYGTMDLTTYVKRLQEQLATAAEAGGDEARELAERLIATLDAAARLVLLDALSTAADEITWEMAPGSVEVRLRGGEPEFVVTLPPADDEYGDVPAPAMPEAAGDADGSARLNLRMPESLKHRIEEAANTEGLSLNAWLVRAAGSALDSATRATWRGPTAGDRFTGWVR